MVSAAGRYTCSQKAKGCVSAAADNCCCLSPHKKPPKSGQRPWRLHSLSTQTVLRPIRTITARIPEQIFGMTLVPCQCGLYL